MSEAEPALRSPSVPPGLSAGIVVAGKYELVRKLGSGSMGEVWAAKHVSLDEEVAIKLVMRDVAHDDGTKAEDRFLFEARIAATLSRKTRHIVNVTDHGEDGAMAYLVMELLHGESLDARILRTGPLPLAKAAPIIRQIARGLAVAHAEGIVHRDLKPSNVFVTVDEDGNAVLKILDFGIAKMRGPARKRRARSLSSAHATMHGFLLGTPAFMSPEQASTSGMLDHRVDVWALAVIAYHLLTGELPFDGDGVEALLARLTAVIPTPIRAFRPDLPDAVESFFDRAFHEDIDARFPSAVALASAFEKLEPRAAGAVVSLPPPSPSDVALPLVAKKSSDLVSTLVAAGVPERGAFARFAVAAALVAVTIVTTIGLLVVYFEREPSAPPHAVVAVETKPPPPPAIPPPEEEETAIAIRPADLPTAPPARPFPRAVVAAVPPATIAKPAPVTPVAPPAVAVEEPSVHATRVHDKSDVF